MSSGATGRGLPNRHRYVNHGRPVELAPHVCYLSAKIRSEVSRLGKLVGIASKDRGRYAGRHRTAAVVLGVTITSEPSLDNYTDIDSIDPGMGNLMAQAGEPKVRLGCCSFSALGYSANPPTDLAAAAAAVNQMGGVVGWRLPQVESRKPALHAHRRRGRSTDRQTVLLPERADRGSPSSFRAARAGPRIP